MITLNKRAPVHLLLISCFALAFILVICPPLALLEYTNLVPQSLLLKSLGFNSTSWSSEESQIPIFQRCSYGSLGIASRTYVVSLPNRTDRRTSMERLKNSLSLDFSFFDAVPSDSPIISAMYTKLNFERLQLNNPVIGDRGPLSAFTDGQGQFSWPPNILKEDSWSSTSSDEPLLFDNVTHDISNPSVPITCATENFTAGVPSSNSTPGYLVLSPAKVACWYSHLQVIQIAAEITPLENADSGSCNNVTLILEDDVDMERDIRSRLRAVWNLLPSDWDIVYLGRYSSISLALLLFIMELGSCWSNESYYAPLDTTTISDSNFPALRKFGDNVHTTTIRPSRAPKCTHAYALTTAGARKLLRYLQYPAFAYSRALDQALSWLILDGRIKSFTIVPSVVAQRKVSTSDVDGGASGFGSSWRDRLEDGVLGE